MLNVGLGSVLRNTRTDEISPQNRTTQHVADHRDLPDLMLKVITGDAGSNTMSLDTIKRALIGPILGCQAGELEKLVKESGYFSKRRATAYVYHKKVWKDERKRKNEFLSHFQRNISLHMTETDMGWCLFEGISPCWCELSDSERILIVTHFSEYLRQNPMSLNCVVFEHIMELLLCFGSIEFDVASFLKFLLDHLPSDGGNIGHVLAVLEYITNTYDNVDDFSWADSCYSSCTMPLVPSSFRAFPTAADLIDFALDSDGKRIVGLTRNNGLFLTIETEREDLLNVPLGDVSQRSKMCVSGDQCFVCDLENGKISVVRMSDVTREMEFSIVKDINLELTFLAFGCVGSDLALIQLDNETLIVTILEKSGGNVCRVHSLPLRGFTIPREICAAVEQSKVHVFLAHWHLSLSFDHSEMTVSKSFAEYDLPNNCPVQVFEGELISARQLPGGCFFFKHHQTNLSDSRIEFQTREIMWENEKERVLLSMTVPQQRVYYEEALNEIVVHRNERITSPWVTQLGPHSRRVFRRSLALLLSVIKQKHLRLVIRYYLISVCLKVLTVNMFILEHARKDDIEELNLDLEGLRSALQAIVTCELVNNDVMRSLLILFTVSYRFLFDNHCATFLSIFAEFLKSETLILYFCRQISFVLDKKPIFLAYGFNEFLYSRCQCFMTEGEMKDVLFAPLLHLGQELIRLTETNKFQALEYITVYLKTLDVFIAKAPEKNADLYFHLMMEVGAMRTQSFPDSWMDIILIITNRFKRLDDLKSVQLRKDTENLDHSDMCNGIMYLLGHLLARKLSDMATSDSENKCNIVLGSGLVDGLIPDWFCNDSDDLPESVDSRSLKYGISEPAQIAFLKDLIEPKENGLARPFLDFMYSSVKALSNRQLLSQNVLIERLAVAALLKHTGLTSTALTVATGIGQSSSVPVVPATLVTVWRTVYRIRTEIMRKRQQARAADSDEDEKNFESFLCNLKMKLRFLLYCQPAKLDMEIAIKMLVSFATSSITMSDLQKALEIRTKRAEAYVTAISMMTSLLGANLSADLMTALWCGFELNWTYPSSTDLVGVGSDLSHSVSKAIAKMALDVSEHLVGTNNPEMLTVLFTHCLAKLIEQSMEIELFEKLFCQMLDSAVSTDSSTTWFYPVWCFLGVLGQKCTKAMIDKLLSVVCSDEIVCRQYLLLLALIPWTDNHQAVLNIFASHINSESFVTTHVSLVCILELLRKNNNGFDGLTVTMGRRVMSVATFFSVLVQGIGSALSGDCFILSEKHSQEQHVFLASEVISCFRLMLKTESQASSLLKERLHTVFSSCGNWAVCITTRQKLTGVFAIIGREILPIQDGCYATCFRGSEVYKTEVRSCDPISGTFAVKGVKHSVQCVCCGRTEVCPNDFLLTDEEISFLCKVPQSDSCFKESSLESLSFIAHFYGFMSVLFQSTENMTKLAESGCLFDFLRLRNVNLGERNLSASHLCHEIGFGITKLSNVRNRVKIKTHDDLLGKLPLIDLATASGVDEDSVHFFIVPCELSSDDQFAFEITDGTTAVAPGLFIGFVDASYMIGRKRLPVNQFYGLDVFRRKVICPFMEYREMLISGPVNARCQLKDRLISFFVNGREVVNRINYPRGLNLVPAVIYTGKPRDLSYKVHSQAEVPDYKLITPQPSKKPPMPIQFNTSTGYRQAIDRSDPIFEKPLVRSPSGPLLRGNSLVEKSPQDASLSSYCESLANSKTSWYFGQPVFLSGMPNKWSVGEIGIIRDVERVKDSDPVLQIEVTDLLTRAKFVCPVSGSSVVPHLERIGNIAKSLAYRISCTAKPKNKEASAIASFFWSSEFSRLQRIVDLYIESIIPALTCFILDYFCYRNKLAEIVDKEELAFGVITLLCDMYPVDSDCKDLTGVNHLESIHSDSQLNKAAIWHCDRAISRVFEAVCARDPKNMQTLLQRILTDEMNGLDSYKKEKYADFLGRDGLFESQTSHRPIMLKIKRVFRHGTVGYIPVILSCPESLEGDSDLLKSSHGRFVSSRTIELSIHSQNPTGRLSFGFIRIPSRVRELQSQSLEAYHVISTIVSIFLSINGYQGMFEFLKREVFGTLMDLVNQAAPFSHVLCGSILSRLLTIPWNDEDISSNFEARYAQFSQSYSYIDIHSLSRPSGDKEMFRIYVSAQVMLERRKLNQIQQSISKGVRCTDLVASYLDTVRTWTESESSLLKLIHCGFVSMVLRCNSVTHDGFLPVLIARPWCEYLCGGTDIFEFFQDNMSLFLRHCELMERFWTAEHDDALSKILNENPDIASQIPLDTNTPDFLSEPILLAFPKEVLHCRMQIFLQGAAYSDLVSSQDMPDEFKPLKLCLPTDKKVKLLEDKVFTDLASGDQVFKVTFNRFKASYYYNHNDKERGEPLLFQFIEQVRTTKDLDKMKKRVVPWRVTLVGEGAADAGGPGRDLFSDVCMEIMNPATNLFIPCPNARLGDGPNQERFIPNPEPFEQDSLQEMTFFYAGFFMALSFITQSPEPFSFPRFMYRLLGTDDPITADDIYSIDKEFKELMAKVEGCNNKEEFDSLNLNFAIQGSDGKMVDLLPGGSDTKVSFEKRMEFVSKAKLFRTNEFSLHIHAMRTGFRYFVPLSSIEFIRPWEIETLVCGSSKCEVSEMKKHIVVKGPQAAVDMLWSVLETLTPKERMLFIKFGCGRMGLPPPGLTWQTPLKIQFAPDTREDSKKPLPRAMTCASTMTIPIFKSSEWMVKKIRAAFQLSASIDLDHVARVSDVQAFT